MELSDLNTTARSSFQGVHYFSWNSSICAVDLVELCTDSTTNGEYFLVVAQIKPNVCGRMQVMRDRR